MANCAAIVRVRHDTQTLLPALQSCAESKIATIVVVDPFDQRFYRNCQRWRAAATKGNIHVVATLEAAEEHLKDVPICVHLNPGCYLPANAFRRMVDQVATHEHYTDVSSLPQWQLRGGMWDWLLFYTQVMLWWQAWRYAFHVRRSDGATIECRRTWSDALAGLPVSNSRGGSYRVRRFAPLVRHPNLKQWYGTMNQTSKRRHSSGWRQFNRLVHESVHTAGISDHHQWTTWLWLSFYSLCMYWCASTLSGHMLYFWHWSYFSLSLYTLFFIQHLWVLWHYVDGSQVTRSILLSVAPLYPFMYFLFTFFYTLVYLFTTPYTDDNNDGAVAAATDIDTLVSTFEKEQN